MLRGWWSRRSLRTRLTAAATVLCALVIAGAAALLLWRVQTSLMSDLDVTAVRQALAVAGGTAQARRPTVPTGLPGDAAVQIVDPSGRVVASSSNIDGEPRLFSFAASPASATPVVRTVAGVPIEDNAAYRVTAVSAPLAGGSYLVYVALPIAPAAQTVTTLGAALAVGVPLLVLVLGTSTWLLVGRALQPVERLRRQAAEITAGDLQRRLDVPPAEDELARLAGTVNEMLARIEGSVIRQRRFVADAAHELRSPVASILAQLEVAERRAPVARAGSVMTADRSPGDVADEARRLSRLVDDLLALARLDAGPTKRTETVDLDDIVLTEIGALRLRTDRTVDASAVSAARVRGDAPMLNRVVRNLLDNAAHHARERIRVGLGTTGGEVYLVVADDGPGIPLEDRGRVFERFTRLDDGRSRSNGGVGIGLAIVRDVVAAHRGTVAVDDEQPGARFTVRLPADRPPASG